MTDKTEIPSLYRLSDLPEPERQWGGWKLDSERLVLEYPAYPDAAGETHYRINLGDCTSSAHVLDEIMQIAGKNWATDECLAGFVHAINDILEPQANLCSFGMDLILNRERIACLVRQASSESR